MSSPLLLLLCVLVSCLATSVYSEDYCKEGLIGEELARCVRRLHHDHDEIISTRKNEYMRNLKCCFQSLRICIAKAEAHESGSNHQRCSIAMIQCVMRKKNMTEFRRDSPPPLRKMFRNYGVCILKHPIDTCMKDYFDDTEELVGMDCLNKYVHCAYSWKDGKQIKGDTCHKRWAECMAPTCAGGTNHVYKTKIIDHIWSCKSDKKPGDVTDSHVTKTLQCIMDMSRDGSVLMSPLLTREHVREGCYLVYGGDNYTGTTKYERCVKDNTRNMTPGVIETKKQN